MKEDIMAAAQIMHFGPVVEEAIGRMSIMPVFSVLGFQFHLQEEISGMDTSRDNPLTIRNL